ncbi:hypothetical protein [Planomicrobium sp. YIM 101495]|uniref:hypothetical protein n=1 Tax=Planomicrobium sp. YIM 101495 TaxID=2665160 RepID=UPI0012B9EECB|nr:hypothetical protein [Planomicrobium sp. YIM 101495]MTD30145.1 hypothetical protein [Planomicrobium sp. YIM 101495]
MAKYVYQRYLARTNYSEEFVKDAGILGSMLSTRGYESYTLNPLTGMFTVSGNHTSVPTTGEDRYRAGSNEDEVINPPGGISSGQTLLKLRRSGTSAVGEIYEVQTNYSRGTYVDEVIADEGAYPIDGRQGSYWYVRGERYAPFPQIKVDGAWKEPVEGFVMIDGEPRPIVESLIKENGEWKTLV